MFGRLFRSSPKRNGSDAFSEGDVLLRTEGLEHYISKILRVDPRGYHVLIYRPVSAIPALSEVAGLEVLVWHAPIASPTSSVRIGNQPVKAEELVGFHTYLKNTDFKRYAEETGQDLNALITGANQAYDRGNDLKDQGRPREAVDAYDKALDLFPMFFEAIDNRAFAKMDLGEWAEAIKDFELSREVNDQTALTEFSIGECLVRLGRKDDARPFFDRAAELASGDPSLREQASRLLNEPD